MSGGMATSGGTAGVGGSNPSGGAADDASTWDIDGLRQASDGYLCLPPEYPIPVGEPGAANDGRMLCFVAEVLPEGCDCAGPARAPIEDSMLRAIQEKRKLWGFCGGSGGPDCSASCACQVTQPAGTAQAEDTDLYACQNEAAPPPSADGFCLIDQMRVDAKGTPAPIGSAALVAECSSSSRRRVRFVGAGTPAAGSEVFLGCLAQ